MNKMEINKMNKDIAELFYNFDFEGFENDKAKKLLVNKDEEIKKLKEKIQELSRDNMRLKYNTIYNNKNSLENIRNEFESRFICLNKEALKSLVTAEYQYNKENEYIDYSGVFLCYIKGFEIEIRSRLKRKNKMTLKELISNLNKIPELITFVKALNKINIIEIRNKGVHNSITTKVQCGILRKLLLEDRWLDRTIQILNDVENEGFVSIDREVYIEEIEDDEWYEGKFYRCGRTADGLYILSKSILGIGNYKVQGQLINNYGINYILIN